VPDEVSHDIPVPSGGRTTRTAAKLDRLLTVSAELMAERGFSQTSIRDVAQASGLSLGGMYYYFRSKEDLLFLIQEKTFASLLAMQEEEMEAGGRARDRLRRLIHNHLAYFTSHFNELKVCTFELESLQGERFERIAHLRRRYFVCVARVIGEIGGLEPGEAEHDGRVRHRALFVFGMLNWVFMWFDPERDDSVEALGEEMVGLILGGLGGDGSG